MVHFTTDPTQIASVYASAASVFESATSVLATATAEVSTRSLAGVAQAAQVTMSYYSIAELAATATDPGVASSASAELVVASSALANYIQHNENYGGNAPSLGGNAALLAVMSLFLGFLVVVGIIYRNWWFLVTFSCGIILEILGYVGRIWSSKNIDSFNGYVVQLVCLTLAPCFIMAGIYYTIAELSVIMGEQYSLLKPMQYSLMFVLFDLISIILQGAGGAIASSSLSEYESVQGGANVMIGGLAFQVFSIGLFQMFWYYFLFRCYKTYKQYGDSRFDARFSRVRHGKLFVPYLFAISLSVLLVFVRSIYRLIELAEGFSSHLATTEIYFFILEALMMSLAILIMLVIYPGFVYGRNLNIPVDKRLSTTFSFKRPQPYYGEYAQPESKAENI
ncbi:hypothetical protein OGAPHI_006144 [Ogataea philodendri]|uniref:Sphingoid long-chain base transporter RSB1 n=1 Tax=Ogataea philodendri TaxID=1378263 RepID=A0A9P8NY88_9ASCO|nr:uncharacterized protein OGAPHI_006144 [Ogataea philodendri]KAH3661965.1 hypothetical protein OGAPHI_006144 [Ogataea philodendri]